MIFWVLDALGEIPTGSVVVELGPEGEAVRQALPGGMGTALQEVRDGTGGATRIGLAALDPSITTVVVMCGDTPLVDPALVAALINDHERSGRAATMVTAILEDGGSYGRVIRDHRGVRVVEARDADHDELAVREINAGLFAFDRAALATALEAVGSKDPKVANTRELENMLEKAALSQLKATFPGAISNDERIALLATQGMSAKSIEERGRILKNASDALKAIYSRNKKRLNEINQGAYRATQLPGDE
jgi:bifunctional N-acetylglucosamine-1-phosphate-uridyltransferase/glucosamine-1-phosphate-acetyltransferase GlmU-like protein